MSFIQGKTLSWLAAWLQFWWKIDLFWTEIIPVTLAQVTTCFIFQQKQWKLKKNYIIKRLSRIIKILSVIPAIRQISNFSNNCTRLNLSLISRENCCWRKRCIIKVAQKSQELPSNFGDCAQLPKDHVSWPNNIE